MGHGAESQEDANDDEGEETEDGDTPDSARSREGMLHCLGIVEEFVAGSDDCHDLAYVHAQH